MTRDATVRLSFAARWRDDARRLRDAQVAWLHGGFNADVLAAPFDLIVDGVHLTADLPDEPVLPLARAWADAVAHLWAGGRRAVVCLEEAPVEVALHRRGERVSLSVLATSPAPALLADDVRLPLEALRDATAGCLVELASHGVGLIADDTVDALRAAARRLDVPPSQPRSPASAPHGVLCVESRSSAGLALTTTLDPEHTGMADADAAYPFDRHVLMAPGTFDVADDLGAAVSLRGAPMAWLDALVDALASGETGELAVPDDAVDARAAVRRVVVGVADVSWVTSSGAALVVADRATLAELLHEHVVGVAATLGRLSSALARNAYLEELLHVAARSAAAVRLRAAPRARSGRAGDGGRPLPALPAEAAGGDDGFPYAASDLAMARVARGATIVRGPIGPRGVCMLPGRRVAVADGHRVEALTMHGDRDWAARLDGGAELRAAPGALIGLTRGGDVRAFDPATGEVRWREAFAAPFAAAAVAGNLVVVADGTARLTVRDATSGGQRAALDGLPVRPSALVVCGGVAVAVLSSGDVVGVDAGGGGLLWRRRAPGGHVRVFAAGDDLAMVVEGVHGAHLSLVDPASGDPVAMRFVTGMVDAVCASPAGVAVTVRDGGTLRLAELSRARGATCDVATGRVPGRARCVAAADGWLVAAGDRVVAVRDGEAAWSLRLGRGVAIGFGVAPGDGLVSAVSDDGLALIDAEAGRVLATEPSVWERMGTLVARSGDAVVVEPSDEGFARLHLFAMAGWLVALEGGAGG